MCPGNYDNYTPLMVSSDAAPPHPQLTTAAQPEYLVWFYIQRVPKKMSFSGKTAITTFKLIQNAKVGGVLENSGYMLHHGH